MADIGSHVTSILGYPYVLPVYPDRSWPRTQFVPAVEPSHGEAKIVKGWGVVFDLVLHHGIGFQAAFQPSWFKWAISEPTTGRRIVTGRTRQDALDGLAELVAYYGGDERFRSVLDASVDALSAKSG